MKIKKMFVLLLAALMLCSLAACQKGKTNENGSNLDWVWVRERRSHGAFGETGYYYTNRSTLYYADFAANASVVLCNTVGCGHDSEECDAYLPSNSIYPLLYWDERIYYFDLFEPVLYSRNSTGLDLKKIGTAGSKYIEKKRAIEIGSYVIADGYLYYEVDVSDNIVMDDGVQTTRLILQGVGRINLSTGKDEMLIEEKVVKQGESKIGLSAVRNDALLISYSTGLAVDRDDPNFLTELANAKFYLVHWDIETGESTTVLEKTIRECSGIQMVSGGKVYYKTHSSVDAEDRGYMYSYDLNTGKTETACNRNMQWLLGGSYVQCYDPTTRERTIYDMNTGKVLPYELDSSIMVVNIADSGFVMSTGKDYYFVAQEGLADGLQEKDLQYLYTF